MGMWCRQLDEVYDLFAEASGFEEEDAKRADLSGRSSKNMIAKKEDPLSPADYVSFDLHTLTFTESDYAVDGGVVSPFRSRIRSIPISSSACQSRRIVVATGFLLDSPQGTLWLTHATQTLI